MNETARRRCLLSIRPKISLIDGSYNDNTVVVSNGNHFAVSNPQIYSQTYVDFSKTISLKKGDVVSFMFLTKPFTSGTTRWYSRAVTQSGGALGWTIINQAPNGGTWYRHTVSETGLTLLGITMEARSYNLIGEFDLTMAINGKVIF